ncbi:hypothetical protein SNEBB_006430 [Seison nebaliae]|nr:hypothetical protein SNEBB_006430 [Seison nebaliae]
MVHQKTFIIITVILLYSEFSSVRTDSEIIDFSKKDWYEFEKKVINFEQVEGKTENKVKCDDNHFRIIAPVWGASPVVCGQGLTPKTLFFNTTQIYCSGEGCRRRLKGRIRKPIKSELNTEINIWKLKRIRNDEYEFLWETNGFTDTVIEIDDDILNQFQIVNVINKYHECNVNLTNPLTLPRECKEVKFVVEKSSPKHYNAADLKMNKWSCSNCKVTFTNFHIRDFSLSKFLFVYWCKDYYVKLSSFHQNRQYEGPRLCTDKVKPVTINGDNVTIKMSKNFSIDMTWIMEYYTIKDDWEAIYDFNVTDIDLFGIDNRFNFGSSPEINTIYVPPSLSKRISLFVTNNNCELEYSEIATKDQSDNGTLITPDVKCGNEMEIYIYMLPKFDEESSITIERMANATNATITEKTYNSTKNKIEQNNFGGNFTTNKPSVRSESISTNVFKLNNKTSQMLLTLKLLLQFNLTNSNE